MGRAARVRRAAPFLSVGELHERWLSAHHDWRPATWISARSNAKALRSDGLAERRVSTLKPEHVRAAMAAWSAAGASVAVISGRFRVLRYAVGWAHVERIIDVNPLSGMRGPQRPGTRLHLGPEEVLSLLESAEALVAASASGDAERLHKAEQIRLLVRLAADGGAARRTGGTSLRRPRGAGAHYRAGRLGRRARANQDGADPAAHPWTADVRAVEIERRDVVGEASRRCRFRSVALLPRGQPPRPAHAPAPSGTGSRSSPVPPRCPGRRCTVCATAWPPFSSAGASCSGPSSASDIGTLRPRCATTPMPCRSRTKP